MFKKTRLTITCLIFVGYSSANAQSMDSMRLAIELGDLLASEDFCGLQYDQNAISDFIDEKVKADDMGFSSNLRMMTDGAAFKLNDLNESQKTVHCRQSGRVAKSFGFIK